MKKIIASGVVMFGLSLMVNAQVNGCAVINGIQVCGNTSGSTATGQTLATTGQVGSGLLNVINGFQAVVNALIPFAIGLAVASLFFGVIMFMWKGSSDEKAHAQWLKFMGMSILGLFVMVSIWGLVKNMGSILGVGQGGGVPIPQVPGSTY